MKYYSLNKKSPAVDFREATIQGQAPDRGLYFPEHIPTVEQDLIKNIETIPDDEIAFRVIKPYVGNVMKEDDLFRIVSETVNFPIPLVNVTGSISSLELFHGPTLAFKDIGARFMSRCLGQFVKSNEKRVTVLVATSGDTGGAVANGFYDVEGVDVVILYPSGKVSSVQEKQLTTLGKNIHALEVKGSFDDCQQMVKQAFADRQLNEKLFLTSANSINVARWLPQQFYYFFAYKQWKEKNNPPVISVPSGNFGNICAGILAHISGLPVEHFIAACNANDTIPQFLDTGNYTPKKAIATLSNAMDVAEPSNFVRILELFHQQVNELKNKLSAYTISDEETLAAIKMIQESYNYLADPHGAVGFLALERYLEGHPSQKGFFLETAHPVKFPDAIRMGTNTEVAIPESVKALLEADKESTVILPVYEELNGFLTKNLS
jgi:threonine synthase